MANLLFSFLTRDNPNGDSFVYQGFGPMRRQINRLDPKRCNGTWNYVLPQDDCRAFEVAPFPNPDTLVAKLTLPFKDVRTDLVELLSRSKEGTAWLEACKTYLDGWKRPMPSKMPFDIKSLKMKKPLFYVEEKGYYSFGQPNEDMIELNEIPKGLVWGLFKPEFFAVPYSVNDGKIGMLCNGGTVSNSGERGGYTIQGSTGLIYLSLPVNGQLLGTGESAAKPFMKTHFVEWVFARHCPNIESNPCPTIRVELEPSRSEDSTLFREKNFSKRMQQTHY